MIKKPIYDGQISFETYKLQFEAARKANSWTEQEKATALVVALRGPSLNLLRTIPAGDKDDFKNLSTALQTHFGEQQKLRD